MYLAVKRRAGKAVYIAECEAERNRFADLSQRKDQICEVFNSTKKMVKSHKDIVGEHNSFWLIAVDW